MKYHPMHSPILFILYAFTLLDYCKFATGFMPLGLFLDGRKSLNLHNHPIGVSVPNLPTTKLFAAKTRARSTPGPTTPPTTSSDLRFWSGESLKQEWAFRDEERRKNINNAQGKQKRSGRKANDEKRSTRFTIVDGSPEASTPKDAYKKFANVKLNGYTLLQDMKYILKEIDENVTISSIATTTEYNDIVLVKMSKKPRKYFRALEGPNKYEEDAVEKKIILIVHGLSPMGFRLIPCLYKVKSFIKLVKIYASYVDKFEIFLIPMANPDGIADETLRIWNKNKSIQKACSGVSLDRNFDVEWNNTNNLNSCSQKYPGTGPFSELESRAVAELIHHYNHKIVAYIHVHAGSYSPDVFKGDAVLYPKGFSDQGDEEKYIDMEAEIEEAMRNAGFKIYGVTVTSMHNWYGKIFGSSVDYATTIYGIPYGLEFVMQPYDLYDMAKDDSEEVSDNVLTEVWKRVIDVVFMNIYRSTEKTVKASSESFGMDD